MAKVWEVRKHKEGNWEGYIAITDLSKKSKDWIARIRGKDFRYRWDRGFLKIVEFEGIGAAVDAKALENNGIYEIKQGSERGFYRVHIEDGKVIFEQISEDEVKEHFEEFERVEKEVEKVKSMSGAERVEKFGQGKKREVIIFDKAKTLSISDWGDRFFFTRNAGTLEVKAIEINYLKGSMKLYGYHIDRLTQEREAVIVRADGIDKELKNIRYKNIAKFKATEKTPDEIRKIFE